MADVYSHIWSLQMHTEICSVWDEKLALVLIASLLCSRKSCSFCSSVGGENKTKCSLARWYTECIEELNIVTYLFPLRRGKQITPPKFIRYVGSLTLLAHISIETIMIFWLSSALQKVLMNLLETKLPFVKSFPRRNVFCYVARRIKWFNERRSSISQRKRCCGRWGSNSSANKLCKIERPQLPYLLRADNVHHTESSWE